MAVNFKSENISRHRELADKIKENLTTEGSLIREKEVGSAYLSNLPEGIDKKHVEDISKYNSKFITAAHVAVGEVASDLFVSDKKLQEVDAEIGYFGKSDKMNISVARQKTYQNHFDSDNPDAEITKHLVMKTTVASNSVKGYGLKSIRASMAEEFKDICK